MNSRLTIPLRAMLVLLAAILLPHSAFAYQQEARLTPWLRWIGAEIGSSVAIDGNWAVVGAPYEIVDGEQQGAAYVFVRRNGTWTEHSRLSASLGRACDRFGYSVGIADGAIVVGAPGSSCSPATSRPAAYVFVLNTWANPLRDEWMPWATLRGDAASPAGSFGRSVAISGRTIVIGAPYDEVGDNAKQGQAHVFGIGQGGWVEQARLAAADGTASDLFGVSVAISGYPDRANTIVVGALYARAAYVFVRTAGAWLQHATLTSADPRRSDDFGSSVAISATANRIVVGAPRDAITTASGVSFEQGSASVFIRYGFGWLAHGLEGKLTASDGAAYDRFGTAVAITGYTVVVGAPQDDVLSPYGATAANQGSVYQFACSGTCNESGRMSVAGYQPLTRFGHAVAIERQAGDSILVGAPYPGAAYVFR